MHKSILVGLALAGGMSANAAHAEIAIGPRIWIMSDNMSSGRLLTLDPVTGAPINEYQAGGTFTLPMAGLSGAFANPFNNDTQIVLSYLQGSDSISGLNTRTVNIATPSGPPTQSTLTLRENQDLDRRDFEISLQRRVGDVGLIGGARFEQARVTTTTSDTRVDVSSRRIKEGYDFISARFGMAGGSAIDTSRGEDARFWFYGAALGFVGSLEPNGGTGGKSGLVYGPDVSVGGLWRISPAVSLDARYRGVFFYAEDDSIANNRITHGLNLTLTARF